MTVREHDVNVLPEMLVVVGSVEDAAALAPLRSVGETARATLVATGSDPMAVDLALDDLGAPAGRVLLPDTEVEGPAAEAAQLLLRFTETLAGYGEVDGSGAPRAAAVVVRGGSVAALAATQAAVWCGVPVLALDAPARTPIEGANRAAIVGLAAWQASDAGSVTYPARLDLEVHRCLDDARSHRVVCMTTTGGTRSHRTA